MCQNVSCFVCASTGLILKEKHSSALFVFATFCCGCEILIKSAWVRLHRAVQMLLLVVTSGQ